MSSRGSRSLMMQSATASCCAVPSSAHTDGGTARSGIFCISWYDAGQDKSRHAVEPPMMVECAVIASAFGFEEGFDERDGRFGAESVAVSAQASHTAGNPCNQRECAGLNWPPLAIPAEEPVSSQPDAVNRAGPPGACESVRTIWSSPISLMRLPDRLRKESTAGVGQPANAACLGNWSRRWRAEPSGFTACVAIPG